jgi:hypothetical protein
MAIVVNDANATLRQNMGAVGADAQAAVNSALLDAIQAIATAIDADAAGTRTYEDVGFSILTGEGASGRQFTVTVATAGLETDDDDVVWIAMGD